MPIAIKVRTHCTSCKQTKSPEDFYVSRKAVSGRSSQCRECSKKRNAGWASSAGGRAYLNAFARAWKASDKGLEYSRAYAKTDKARAADKRKRERNKLKVKARRTTRTAIEYGRLVRGPCSECACPNAEAHHEDYSKPLDVTWLCGPCHRAHHREVG